MYARSKQNVSANSFPAETVRQPVITVDSDTWALAGIPAFDGQRQLTPNSRRTAARSHRPNKPKRYRRG